MPDTPAIQLKSVSKVYRLHGSQRDQLIDILGLSRIGIRPRTPAREFTALSDISLDVPSGHRIGIVGRNGAGKSTLLKLICGNYAPTHGEINVTGTVQALMSMGLGFHPEYTGRENAETSLLYNGLTRNEYQKAMKGIIEFCELGEFLDQPFKTYSLGMQARLMFATATAVRPDILIVDEVLGAGDAYFIAKSKRRIEALVSSGCTMLLVSHSMQQVLELCDEAIWLDQGRVRMKGKTFDVVKAYEAYLHGPIEKLESASNTAALTGSEVKRAKERIFSSEHSAAKKREMLKGLSDSLIFQEPIFLPHANRPELPEVSGPVGFNFTARGGISRWDGEGELQFVGFSIVHENGIGNTLLSLHPAKFILELQAQREGEYSCRYSVNISDHGGQTVCSLKSPEDRYKLSSAGRRMVEVLFNPLQLGPGEYTVGIVVLGYGPLEVINTAKRYDLLSRSFEFRIELPSSWSALQNQFFHSVEWQFQ